MQNLRIIHEMRKLMFSSSHAPVDLAKLYLCLLLSIFSVLTSLVCSGFYTSHLATLQKSVVEFTEPYEYQSDVIPASNSQNNDINISGSANGALSSQQGTHSKRARLDSYSSSSNRHGFFGSNINSNNNAYLTAAHLGSPILPEALRAQMIELLRDGHHFTVGIYGEMMQI